ncbi:MAG: SDR family NAD(P)-dependent oxidoreductase [Dehalococcoidales bacterium]|nr:SDR family NAD(P)-dependent oxidoreductase [Dehalococcoidales bacterium]
MPKLDGKVALVTGAGRGIGKAIAVRLAADGARVVLCDKDLAFAEHVADKLRKTRYDAIAVRADVSVWQDVETLFIEVSRVFGGVDILVNNAGIRQDISLHKVAEQDWDSIISVQTKGCINCCRLAQAHMVTQKWGKIVNISSPVPAVLGEKTQSLYAAANAAIDGFTKALALELGPFNINVNGIAPDYIDTEMLRDTAKQQGMYIDDFRKIAVSQIALKRMGDSDDIAGVVSFLVSEDASFITGQVIQVKGGP